jgi:membrane dipeptidase
MTAAETAKSIFEDSLVWDMVWPWEPWCGNDFDKLSEFREAGIDVLSITLAGDRHNISETVQRVGAARRRLRAMEGQVTLVENTKDVQAARQLSTLGVALHLEGTRCFERNLDMVEVCYRLGIRHTLLAFNQSNSTGGGCAEAADGGLTNFGRQLIRELEEVGMLVDLSHTGYRTTLDAIEYSSRPVIFSHSNAYELSPHFRNIRDDQVKACAAIGGVVGVSGASIYLGTAFSTSNAVFAHIDHFVELVGPDHVGLGLDVVFDSKALNEWVRKRPEEWPGSDSDDWPGFSYTSPGQTSELAELMLSHGYAEGDVRKILGENFLRVCQAVWRE